MMKDTPAPLRQLRRRCRLSYGKCAPMNNKSVEEGPQPELVPPSLKSALLEREAVGACLMGGESLTGALDAGLNADCFAYPVHRRLFERLRELHLSGVDFSMLTVYGMLDTPLLESLGGIHGLYELSTAAGTGLLVRLTVKKLLDLAEKRRSWIAVDKARCGLEGGMDTAQAMTPVRRLAEDTAAATGCRILSQQEATSLAYHTLGSALQQDSLCGVTTGFPTLDSVTGGLQPDRFYVLGARPGVGKTAFALRTALAAAESGVRTLFATAEMSAEQLMERAISMVGTINLAPFRAPGQRPATFVLKAVNDAIRDINKRPLSFMETAANSAEDVAEAVRAEHRRQPLGLIVLDYLQRFKSGSPRAEASEVDNTAAVSLIFSTLATTLHVPILALAQLNRDCARSNRAPQLTDLKGSSQIEQDADMVVLLHRPEVGLPPDAPADDRAAARRKTCLYIVKHRHGCGECTIPLSFAADCTMFREAGNTA